MANTGIQIIRNMRESGAASLRDQNLRLALSSLVLFELRFELSLATCRCPDFYRC